MTISRRVTCCIVGGGPAGMMLGLLLGRAGVATLVLEKHKDFLRDFRGDTIHPSTLQVMRELGLLQQLLKIPHTQVRRISIEIGRESFKFADFEHVPTACPFIALMPQWDFLDFLAQQGKQYPSMEVLMQAEAVGLIEEGNRVQGVEVATPEGKMQVRADLVVGCDGRSSTVREAAGLIVEKLGVPIDVLWFRLSQNPGDPQDVLGHIEPDSMLVTINRTSYWQCACVIAKGSFDQIKESGLDAFRSAIARAARFLADRVGELKSFDDVKLLSVSVDRLEHWSKAGLLCIGDAAHAMSPVGGVGINLAIQDAVATANIIAEPLRSGTLSEQHLQSVQSRRSFPARVIQRGQVFIHRRFLAPRVAHTSKRVGVPWIVRLVSATPWLRRWPAQIIGVGIRPEHVRSPVAASLQRS